MWDRHRLVALAVLLATATPACALMVSTAASLREAVDRIGNAFERETGVPVQRNFGGSGVLARQVEEGGPIDVLISAGWPEIERLQEKGLVGGQPVVVARNRLVVIVPDGSPWAGRAVRDLLPASGVTRVAIGDPAAVPAGHYARAALQAAGFWEGLTGRIVLTGDVRQALTYAERGSVDAAIVYATDARLASRVAVVGPVPGSDALRIEAVAVRMARSTDPAAARFLEFLVGESARRVFADLGFLPPAT